MASCLFIFQPFEHLFDTWFLAIHQDADAVNFGREPDDKYSCGKQQGKRKQQFPYRNVER